MKHSLRTLLVGLCCVLANVGCESKKERNQRLNQQVLSENQAELDSRIDSLRKMVADLKTKKPLTKTTLNSSGHELSIADNQSLDPGNTIVIVQNDLEIGEWEFPFKITNAAHAIQMLKEDDVLQYCEESVLKSWIETVLSARYVLVIRETQYTEPRNTVNPASRFNGSPDLFRGTTFFYPGHYIGEAHLLDLTNRKSLGGFRFEASNSPTVRSGIQADLQQNVIKSAVQRMYGITQNLEYPNRANLDPRKASLLGYWVTDRQPTFGFSERIFITRYQINEQNVDEKGAVLVIPSERLLTGKTAVQGRYDLIPGDTQAIDFRPKSESEEPIGLCKGIYRLRGDRLQLRIANPGEPRPESFVEHRTSWFRDLVCRRAYDQK